MPKNYQNGISFDKHHSYRDYKLLLVERPATAEPSAKLNMVEIPGADGALDLTEATTGEVRFNNRTMPFKFKFVGGIPEQRKLRHSLLNDLHGQKMKVVLDEDANYYYYGRISVAFDRNANANYCYVVITVNADPFKYEIREAVATVELEDNPNEEIIGTPQTSTSQQEWNTSWEFDPAIDIDAYSTLVFTWPQTHIGGFMKDIRITGGGRTGAFSISNDEVLGGYYRISRQQMLEKGINLKAVTRISVSMIGDCTVTGVPVKYVELCTASLPETGTKTIRFPFGTKEIPLGDFSAFDGIEIEWNPIDVNAGLADLLDFRIFDYNTSGLFGVDPSDISDVLKSGRFLITKAEILAKGLDPSKIYLVTAMSNVHANAVIKEAVLNGYVENATELIVKNGRKTVVPTFIASATTSVIVRGKSFELISGITSNPEITFTHGKNRLLFTGTSGTVITVRWQRGWL